MKSLTLLMVLFLSFVNLSCSRKSPIYTVSQVDRLMVDVEVVPWPMAPMLESGEAAANPELLRLVGSRRFVNEANYGEGLHPEISARQYRVDGLVFLLVPYQTQEQARAAAERYQQWYARNWLIDDVMGEPGLEELIVKRLGAQKPD